MMVRHPLVASLERGAALADAERLALGGLPFGEDEVLAGEGVAWSGEGCRRVTLVLAGILASSKAVAEGRVQVTGFHVPGDMPDLQALHLGRMDVDVVALTNARVAWFDRDALRRLAEAHPGIGERLWRMTLVEAAIAREWVVNVGRRSAVARVAHLLCELMARMEAAGLADGERCRLGLTSRDLGEAMGLSAVDCDRAMEELRGRGLVSLGQGLLVVHDRAGLAAVGDFRPGYLHLAA